MIDRNNYHTFQQLLYQLAMGALSPGDIAQPLRLMLRALNIQVIMKEVTGFDLDRRNAHLQDGAEIEFDSELRFPESMVIGSVDMHINEAGFIGSMPVA
jgi:NADH dehydrogenase